MSIYGEKGQIHFQDSFNKSLSQELSLDRSYISWTVWIQDYIASSAQSEFGLHCLQIRINCSTAILKLITLIKEMHIEMVESQHFPLLRRKKNGAISGLNFAAAGYFKNSNAPWSSCRSLEQFIYR